jgi:hypothetical protein
VCIDCVSDCPDVHSLSTKTNRYKANYTTGISLNIILYNFILYLVKNIHWSEKMVKIKIVQEDPLSSFVYSRINSITTPASGAGNVREPYADLIRRKIARSGVRVCQCVFPFQSDGSASIRLLT